MSSGWETKFFVPPHKSMLRHTEMSVCFCVCDVGSELGWRRLWPHGCCSRCALSLSEKDCSTRLKEEDEESCAAGLRGRSGHCRELKRDLLLLLGPVVLSAPCTALCNTYSNSHWDVWAFKGLCENYWHGKGRRLNFFIVPFKKAVPIINNVLTAPSSWLKHYPPKTVCNKRMLVCFFLVCVFMWLLIQFYQTVVLFCLIDMLFKSAEVKVNCTYTRFSGSARAFNPQ